MYNICKISEILTWDLLLHVIQIHFNSYDSGTIVTITRSERSSRFSFFLNINYILLFSWITPIHVLAHRIFAITIITNRLNTKRNSATHVRTYARTHGHTYTHETKNIRNELHECATSVRISQSKPLEYFNISDISNIYDIYDIGKHRGTISRMYIALVTLYNYAL